MTEGHKEENKESNKEVAEKEEVGIQSITPDDEYEVEIFELEDWTAKDKLRKEILKSVQSAWFETVEEFVAKMMIAKMTWEITKSDDILLKYLRFLWETQWYTASTKEYNIVSKIPQLNRKSLLSA